MITGAGVRWESAESLVCETHFCHSHIIYTYRLGKAAAYKAIAVKEIENYDKLILPFRFDYFFSFLSIFPYVCLFDAREATTEHKTTQRTWCLSESEESWREVRCVVRKTRWKGGKFFFLSLPISDTIRFVICRQMPISPPAPLCLIAYLRSC